MRKRGRCTLPVCGKYPVDMELSICKDATTKQRR
jgi:hypothetical protein